MANKKGKVIIFSAPSGSGKSTIIDRLISIHGLRGHFSISATSRAPRGTEEDGIHYHFLTESDFRKKIDAGDFLEYEEVYQGHLYGTLKSEVDQRLERGENVILDIDVKGAMRIKKVYGDDAITLFIQPPSIEELQRRLEKRATDDPEKIAQRLDRAKEELSYAQFYDYKVINDDLLKACDQAHDIIHRFLEGEKHILLYPGSFNPLHVGHLGLANYIIEDQCDRFDELWFMLTPKSPFKQSEHLLDDDFRADWIREVIKDYHKVRLSLEEKKLPHPHYTYNTIIHLKEKYPRYQFTLLIGSDSLETLEQWYRADELLELIDILVYPRPDHTPEKINTTKWKNIEILHDTPLLEISGTMVRRLIKEGKAIPFILGIDMDHPLYLRLSQEILKLP